MKFVLDVLPVIIWAVAWWAGGWLLTLSLFRVRRSEAALVGLGLGLVLEVWLANLLAHVLPFVAATWLGAALLVAGGAAALLRLGRRDRFAVQWRRLTLLAAIFWLFSAMGG